MSRSANDLRLIFVAMVALVLAGARIHSQTVDELSASARARIEQARASIVTVKAENESGQTVAQAKGFTVRSDLVVTDPSAFSEAPHVRVVAATKTGTLEVLTTGHYFLPYVLLRQQSQLTPLRLGDSESVAVNDRVYMFDDHDVITAGRVTGMTTIKNDRAFLTSLAINGSNKGAPIFNRDGEVIGIAAQSQDASSAGLVLSSVLLERLKHLNEPGVGIGSGTGGGIGPGDGRVLLNPSLPRDTDESVASKVDVKPVAVTLPRPRYTEAARLNKIQGTVTLRILIDENGDVKDVRVLSGLPDGLNEQAIAAAREAKFKPAMKDGKPVAYRVVVRMDFTIR